MTEEAPNILNDQVASNIEAEPTAPANDGAIQEAGAQVDWKEMLSEDTRASKSIESVKSLDDLVKSYEHTKSLVGRKVEDMDPEQISAVYNKLGRPETPEGYEIEAGQNDDADIMDWYKQAAFEAGLPKEGTQSFLNKYKEFEASALEKRAEAAKLQNQVWVDDIKKELGPAFERDIGLAQRAVREHGGDELAEVLEKAGVSNHPLVVKAFINAGKNLTEDNFISSGHKSGIMSPAEAREKINTMRADPVTMKHYQDSASPRFKEIRKEFDNLYAVAAQG